MLALVEQYLKRIQCAKTPLEIVSLLDDIRQNLNFRSAYLLEYKDDMRSIRYILDTSPKRAGWWEQYSSNGVRADVEQLSSLLSRGGVQRYNRSRFSDSDDAVFKFTELYDMVDCSVVPVLDGVEPIGAAVYCGDPELDDNQLNALLLLSYNLFMQAHGFDAEGVTAAQKGLTPREREVMDLSSEGYTSSKIADELGMSARTVNQHLDNVAQKLGTRNRVQTVAEAIRRGLLE